MFRSFHYVTAAMTQLFAFSFLAVNFIICDAIQSIDMRIRFQLSSRFPVSIGKMH